jgi:hypothetical protein
MRKLGYVAIAAFGLLFSSSLPAQDCSQPNAPAPNVQPSFQLTVTDSSGQPLAGVKVTLGTIDRYQTLHPVSNGVTDQQGVLSFRHIPTGAYSFRFSDHNGERQMFAIQVATDGEQTLQYAWPITKWVNLSVASGNLMHDDEPLRHLHVSLEDFYDGRELATSDTDLLGRFDLPFGRPGRYWMDVAATDSAGNTASIGKIPVSIGTADASGSSDQIFVNRGACGVTYDQFCTLPPAKLETSCIQMVNPGGLAVANAHATFRSAAAASATTLNANAAGVIQFPSLAAGDYQLQIFAAGYTPIRRTLTVSSSAGACRAISVVTMNPFGSGCAPLPGKAN